MPLLILIAEDDPGIRLAVNDYLELSGYGVITAENGDRALLLIEQYHPHLLISDIKMPGKDGYELVKQIRRQPEFRLLPVIFLTEFGTTKERIRGYEAGCDIYLPKPFEMEELGAVIRNLLERSHTIQSELRFTHGNAQNHQLDLSLAQRGTEADRTMSQEEIIAIADLLSQIELTERERQVLHLLTQGLSNGEIGDRLHLSPRTIEKYVTSLLRKTDTSKRAELIRFALEHHLVQ
ncbi:response regulator transcription factor [Pleurocapsales cyanobacterium LEGE 06147]|nr:response regulator transcription factor [Pleurocapsales cyanobacterium LEGE 06147]